MNDVKQKPIPAGEIVIDDKQMVKWLKDKDVLVKSGRELSKELEALEKQIAEYEEKEKEITSKVVPQDLIDEGNALRDTINEGIKKLEEIGNKIRDEKLKAIPPEMEKEHLALNDKREKLEKERNKVALKVQKIKDRFVPKLQKEAKQHLGEYEDLMSAELSADGTKVMVQKFSHLEEWKRQFNARFK